MDTSTIVEDLDFDSLLEDNYQDIKQEEDNTQESTDSTVKEDEDKSESNDSEELNDDELLYNTLAKELYERNIFNSYENIKSEEDLYNAFQESVKTNEYKDLTDQQKLVLEAFRNGIPEEDIINNQKDISDYNSISYEDIESKISIRERILTKFYLSKGMTQDEAIDTASLIAQSNQGIEKTESALSKLKEESEKFIENQKQENEKLELERNQETERILSEVQSKIRSIDKIDSIKISEGVRNKAYETLTKSVDVDEYGNNINKIAQERMKDPIGFEARVAIMFELTNGFKDFKNISKVIETKQATKISDLLGRKTNRASNNTTNDPSILDQIQF